APPMTRPKTRQYEFAGILLSGLPESGQLTAQWGNNRICHASYRLPEKKGPAGVYLTQATCRGAEDVG
ncbi:hypothetical protein FSJ48_022685, partial [Escherichia coli]|nr:hypothetical protein [Escherichia coli]